MTNPNKDAVIKILRVRRITNGNNCKVILNQLGAYEQLTETQGGDDELHLEACIPHAVLGWRLLILVIKWRAQHVLNTR